MIYNVLVVFYNNKYIFDFSDFLLPQTPGATYMTHMTNSLNYCNFIYLFFCLFMTKSLLFNDQIFFFLMWCILRLSRVNIATFMFESRVLFGDFFLFVKRGMFQVRHDKHVHKINSN